MFVSRIFEEGQGNIKREEENIMNYQTLNENQRIVFKQIESHYSNMLAEHSVKSLRIIVMRTAGIKKTYLIKGI